MINRTLFTNNTPAERSQAARLRALAGHLTLQLGLTKMTAPDATTRLQDLPMELPPMLPVTLPTSHSSLTAKCRAETAAAQAAQIERDFDNIWAPNPSGQDATKLTPPMLLEIGGVAEQLMSGTGALKKEMREEIAAIDQNSGVSGQYSNLVESSAAVPELLFPVYTAESVLATKSHQGTAAVMSTKHDVEPPARLEPIVIGSGAEAAIPLSTTGPSVLVVDDGMSGRAEAKRIVASLAKNDIVSTIVKGDGKLAPLSDDQLEQMDNFMSALSVAVQLGMRLDTRMGSEPAPKQLMDWLNDPGTPPSYMQVVMESLMPGSNREVLDLQSRLTDANRVIDILQPDFDMHSEELTESQQQHVRLWRQQQELRERKAHEARMVLTTVMGMAATDPIMESMMGLFGSRDLRKGYVNADSRKRAKSPEQLAAERQQAKDIQLHNHAIDKRKKDKAAKKAARKAGR